ncbi:hypothetical protein INT43_004218, partial [Umbelopsis isabellina]
FADMVAEVANKSALNNGIANKAMTNGGDTAKSDKKRSEQKHRRRTKKKSRKQREEAAKFTVSIDGTLSESAREGDDDLDDVEIEYVPESLESYKGVDEQTLEQFSSIFKHFQVGNVDENDDQTEAVEETVEGEANTKDENDNAGDEEDGEDGPLSKKKMKQINRLSVAELKQLVDKPDVVEWWDISATDPKLLVHLKAYRNTVPVPIHWSQKRKYLQGKRGIEKQPWELPEFIKDTGIMEMRDAVKTKEDASKMKSKMREKVQPKMGKLDIDYQKLHDAFFRFQTKPRLTAHGELYYEGKEFETKLKEKKPGQLSEELKTALSIPPLAPPPWLINMQRFGPPPSYPSLRIPGLNSPIPEGAQWGYHPGGWGRPPIDEYNRPLYGDVFGLNPQEAAPEDVVQPMDKKLWGELDSDIEEEEEDEEEEEEGEEEETEQAEGEAGEEQTNEDALAEGLVTPSGMASVASGLETPDFIELRKNTRKAVAPESDEPKHLYQVLPEVQKNIQGFMGSQHGYNLSNINAPAADTTGRSSKRKMGESVDVALDPSELESGIEESKLRANFEAAKASKLPQGVKEDFSDMVADRANKDAKKRKLNDGKKDSKKKEFKF